MKTQHRKGPAIIAALFATALSTAAVAQTQPQTPNPVKTRIGDLKFEQGFPTEETSRKFESIRIGAKRDLGFWQRSLTDVGAAGPDAGKGGKYLLLPPGYTGTGERLSTASDLLHVERDLSVAPTGACGTVVSLALAEARLMLQPESEKAAKASTSPAAASDGDSQELAKKLANPVASLISVPFQFDYDKGYGPDDADRVALNIQPVIPFSISEDWNLITRTIIPVIYEGSLAAGDDSDLGIGDVTQSFFFSPKEPVGGWILAVGPVALWPTGTAPALRSEQLGLGPTVLALRQDHGWSYGILANHIWGVTESQDHPDVNATFLQPFVDYTWPSATSLSFNTESTYDWTGGQWTVPVNLRVSQVVRVGNQPVQFFIGGRYYAESPEGGPEWGIRFGFTLLFPK